MRVKGWHCRHVQNRSFHHHTPPQGLKVLTELCFLFLFAKRLKGSEEKKKTTNNYLFVLSNLIYVIHQIDRLFGKPDGSRLKSSVFPVCGKLCPSGHTRSVGCVWCAMLTRAAAPCLSWNLHRSSRTPYER